MKQSYNSRSKMWVLIDDEKKGRGGIIDMQKDPFPGVKKEGNGPAGPVDEKAKTEHENDSTENEKPVRKSKKKSGLLGFFSG